MAMRLGDVAQIQWGALIAVPARFFISGLVRLFGLVNQRANPVHLAAFGDLVANALNHLGSAGVGKHLGDDGGAPRRQLINRADFEVSQIGHGQGAWNGGSTHHQQMRLQLI